MTAIRLDKIEEALLIHTHETYYSGCRYNEGSRDWQNEVSLNRGSFSYILLLLGQNTSFVIPRTSLHRGPLF